MGHLGDLATRGAFSRWLVGTRFEKNDEIQMSNAEGNPND